MKTKWLFVLAFIISISMSSKGQSFEWANVVESNLGLHGTIVEIDQDENVYFSGDFNGIVDFDPGINEYLLSSQYGTSSFIQKLDSDGELIWAVGLIPMNIQSTSYILIKGLVLDELENVYLAGYFVGKIDFDPGPDSLIISTNDVIQGFILKLDQDGNFIWFKKFDSNGMTIESMAKGGSNSLCIAGTFSGDTDFDMSADKFIVSPGNSYKWFVLQIDLFGNFEWVRHSTSEGDAKIQEVNSDFEGNVFITGYFSDSLIFNGNPEMKLVTAGEFGYIDGYVFKFDSSGKLLWNWSFGSIYNDRGMSVAFDNNGNVYMTGIFSIGIDLDPGPDSLIFTTAGAVGIDFDCFVVKLSPSGNLIWGNRIGMSSTDGGAVIRVNENCEPYVIGNFIDSIDLDPGVFTDLHISNSDNSLFIVSLDAKGHFKWGRSVTSPEYSKSILTSRDLHISKNQSLCIAGWFYGIYDLDPNSGESIFGDANDLHTSAFIIKLIDEVIGECPIMDPPEKEVNPILYPNPSSGVIYLDFIPKDVYDLLNVYNSNGVFLQEVKISDVSLSEIYLPEEKGLYFFELRKMDGARVVKRVLKM